jgi:hypothetical protein
VPEQYSAATPPRHSFASRHSAAGGGLRVGAAPSLPGPGGCWSAGRSRAGHHAKSI